MALYLWLCDVTVRYSFNEKAPDFPLELELSVIGTGGGPNGYPAGFVRACRLCP